MDIKKTFSWFLLLTIIIICNHLIAQIDNDTVIIRSDQKICYNSRPDSLKSEVRPEGGEYLYQWESSEDLIDWNEVGENDTVYWPPELEITTYFRLVVDTVKPPNDRGWPDTSNVLSITVYDTLIAGSITDTIEDVICHGGDVGTLIAGTTGGSESFTFTWYKNHEVVPDVNGDEYEAGVIYDSTVFYYHVVDVGECGEGFSDTIAVTTFNELNADSITGGNTPICDGQDAGTLTAHYSGGSGKTLVKWYKNENEYLGDGVEMVLDTLMKTAVFHYTIYDSICEKVINSETITIEVTDNITVKVDIEVTPGTEVCINENATFTADDSGTGGLYPEYNWKVNGFSEQTGDSPIFVTSSLNNGDKVSCLLTSSIECTEEPTVESNEIEMIVLPTVEPSITIIADNESICYNDPVTFSSSTEYPGTTPSYEWLINDEPQGINDSTLELNSIQNGDIIKAYMVSDAKCRIMDTAISNEIEIEVLPRPEIDTLWIKTSPEIGPPVVLIVCCTEEENGYTYQWYRNDAVMPGETGQYYYKEGGSGIAEGTYICRVGNNYSCYSHTREFTYPSEKDLSYNGNELFIVYPNPSNGQFKVELNNNNIPAGTSSVTAILYSLTGERVYSGSISSSTSYFDFTKLNAGIYYLELKINKGPRQIKKLVLQ